MIWVYIINIICSILSIWFLPIYLHIFQLRDYNAKRYLSYFSLHYIIITIIYASLFVAEILIFKLFLVILLNAFAIAIFLTNNLHLIVTKHLNSTNNHNLKQISKTPIKFTERFKRIYVLSVILLILPIFFKFGAILCCFLTIFVPIIANFLNFYDKIKNRHFISDAENKLKNSNAKVIAITGSNGKTSVKNILKSMLETQYKVVASPNSFNTPIGLSKFINETDLNVDYVILEYGARHKKDIENLCKIFGADYGIITQVAPQHLQTFKSIENIAIAKGKLSEFLKNKPCVYNIDNEFILPIYNKKQGIKFSVSTKNNADIYATNIRFKYFENTFDLNFNNTTLHCKTRLLGEHNISNILLSSALALHLKITPENLQTAISNLEYVPHRLEYIKGRINILDDSYNCSIASATESIKVLLNCPNKNMVVTPGIIEGGKQQYELNFKLGKLIANCDNIVIVGAYCKQALTDGIKDAVPTKKILYAQSLEDAKQYFNILSNNDTLLLLNDLPDDYN